MTCDRERDVRPGRDGLKAADRSLDEALRACAAEDDATSSDDVDASTFLERLPVTAGEAKRPENG